MHRLGGMKIYGRSAGAAQGGRQHARDVPGFADAGDHYLSRVGQDQIHARNSSPSSREGGSGQRGGFYVDGCACGREPLRLKPG